MVIYAIVAKLSLAFCDHLIELIIFFKNVFNDVVLKKHFVFLSYFSVVPFSRVLASSYAFWDHP